MSQADAPFFNQREWIRALGLSTLAAADLHAFPAKSKPIPPGPFAPEWDSIREQYRPPANRPRQRVGMPDEKFRFTAKGETFYAFGLCWPDGAAVVKSLAARSGAVGNVAQTKPNAEEQKKPQDSAQPSTLEVKPGSPVLKQKDLWEGTGVLHPLLRMPKYIVQDQKAIWTSPFHTSKQDMKFWAVFGTAIAAFIATDQWSVKQLPNSSSQVSVSKWASRAGSAYSLIPISAGFYFIGTGTHEERLRETACWHSKL